MNIAPAHLHDIKYIDHLQRKNADELAFYPRVVFEREIPLHRVLLAHVNGEPAGYLYHGCFSTTLRIHQACIQYDLRGRLYGAALIQYLLGVVKGTQVLSIVLRCGSDIEANGFWQAMGFQCIAVKPGGARRMRDINVWQMDVHTPLFTTSVQPSEKQQDATMWAAGRRMGLSSNRFVRGRGMDNYRDAVQQRTRHD